MAPSSEICLLFVLIRINSSVSSLGPPPQAPSCGKRASLALSERGHEEVTRGKKALKVEELGPKVKTGQEPHPGARELQNTNGCHKHQCDCMM